MSRSTAALLCLACLSLSSCTGDRTAGEHIAGPPPWMSGLPDGVPPRRGTPEYDAWDGGARPGSRPAEDRSAQIACALIC
jgi:hypothetical protein